MTKGRHRAAATMAIVAVTTTLVACSSSAPMVAPDEPLVPPAAIGEMSPDALQAQQAADDGSDEAPGGAGAEGMGDDYYPESGNGGYQVAGYDLRIMYDPESNDLEGLAELTLVVTADDPLVSFNLDLQPTMTVSTVRVDGASAAFQQEAAELAITPAAGLEPDAVVTVRVGYSGQPDLISDGTASLGDAGWYRTQGGGALVAGEPYGASAWFPVNEHPQDAAIYRVTTTVPTEWDVISNGIEQEPPADTPEGMHTVVWEIDDPIASYLVTVWIDKFERLTDELDDGTPVVSATLPDDAQGARLHARTPLFVEHLVSFFGPYPFDAVGGLYVREDLPFALETATRPVYATWVDDATVIHELAHQWFGDMVRPLRWADVCLSECLASYSEWLVGDALGQYKIDDVWRDRWDYAAEEPSFWSSPLVDMGPGEEFTSVYDRGPLALHVLRQVMGDDAFLELLRLWPEQQAWQAATFDEFVELAQSLTDKDLTHTFDVWFRGTEVPSASDVPKPLR